ncbi:hypothetical protein CHS0354_011179 [Potamilus streckersoni]|uniref:Uncharacterized protein n=1 Tax=Potamilus streckersoni TaxID=2493646 RepID=A0AAE0VNJ9_9BIVA|nr:hypothetical protein CHS0354_011179 [Potamilus streckersoni]
MVTWWMQTNTFISMLSEIYLHSMYVPSFKIQDRTHSIHKDIHLDNRGQETGDIIDLDALGQHPSNDSLIIDEGDSDVIENDDDYVKVALDTKDAIFPLYAKLREHDTLREGNVSTVSEDEDDGNFFSGSGSGDNEIEAEEITFNTTMTHNSTESDNIQNDDAVFSDLLTEDTNSNQSSDPNFVKDKSKPLPICEELHHTEWSLWSPWIQAGDADIRYRQCPVRHAYNSHQPMCNGSYFEIRKCSPTKKRECLDTMILPTEEYDISCKGIDIDDLEHSDEIRNPYDHIDDCRFSLYDMTTNIAVKDDYSSMDLKMDDDTRSWCDLREKYVLLYTPKTVCRRNLETLCKTSTKCSYDKKRKNLKFKGDMLKSCWERFVLRSQLPEGFQDDGSQFMICQRFDKSSRLGQIFDNKRGYFATLYDTARRIPVFSMTTVRHLSNEKWPHVPYMIEKSLIEKYRGPLTWLFSSRGKGMVTQLHLDGNSACPSKPGDDDLCKHGENQALESDYEYSGYRIAQLLSPDLVESGIGNKIATYTLTNTAPMHPTLIPYWKRISAAVRHFALTNCKIPLLEKDTNDTEKDANLSKVRKSQFPEMYLLSGVVPSIQPDETLGNDVNIPAAFWIGACCIHGAEVSSFGAYLVNQNDGDATVISIQNLQAKLSRSYKYKNVTNINLFPAFDGICSSHENDVSYKIFI